MDLRALMNPVSDGAAPAAAAQAAAQAYAHPQSHPSPYSHSQSHSPALMKTQTPQRTVSLAAHPLPASYQSHSPPPIADKVPLPRTTSLPAQVSHYRRESSASVSPKTMPPPAPVPYNQTPSPAMSRKRSLSISDHQHTPQPMAKKRRYDPRSPPPWARRERDGHRFVLTPRSEPNATINNNSVTPQTPQDGHMQQQKPGSAPPGTPGPAQPHQQMNSQPQPSSSLEPSLDNMEPYNDMERQVCDFLFQNIIAQNLRFNHHTKVEVEAKLGSIKDWSDESRRLALPILTDTVLDPSRARPKFESSMKTDQHSRLNKYLNMVTQQSQRPGRVPVHYRHTRETDFFYDIPKDASHLIDPAVIEWHNRAGNRGTPRLRVTRDNGSGDITAVIIKTKVANLEVHCPNDEFDFRVSISLETQWPHAGWDQFPEHLDKGVRTSRNKDRLSYRHQGYLVDLTQVTPFVRQGEKVDKIHELEIEMDVERLVEEGYKNMNGQQNEYEKLVHVFLNDVKVVNRAAKASQGPPPMQQTR